MNKAINVAAIFVLCTAANAGPSQSYLNKWERICSDSKNRSKYVECWRPPGDYQAVYEMTGAKKKRAMKQGEKALRMSRETDRHMNKNRRTRSYR